MHDFHSPTWLFHQQISEHRQHQSVAHQQPKHRSPTRLCRWQLCAHRRKLHRRGWFLWYRSTNRCRCEECQCRRQWKIPSRPILETKRFHLEPTALRHWSRNLNKLNFAFHEWINPYLWVSGCLLNGFPRRMTREREERKENSIIFLDGSRYIWHHIFKNIFREFNNVIWKRLIVLQCGHESLYEAQNSTSADLPVDMKFSETNLFRCESNGNIWTNEV